MWRRGGALSIVGLSACSIFTNLDGFSGGGGGGGNADAASPEATDANFVFGADGAAAEASDDHANDGGDGGPRCKGTAGPTPVLVDGYCIDATEVTYAQYDLFLAARSADAGGQPAECAFNTKFDPDFDTGKNDPVHAIDWCDAFMYCQWAGKRLCGKIGGGATPQNLIASATVDEWFRVCSMAGTRDYPYGDAYVRAKCNTDDVANNPAPVGSYSGCEGGYPGIFDMAGNVWEWTNTCAQGGATAECSARGGSYAPNQNGLCAQPLPLRRDGSEGADVGVRCCSDTE